MVFSHRIALHCDDGAWRTLLRQCGFVKKQQPAFDLGPANAQTLRLYSALGTSYEDIHLKMTTAPFWVTFQSTAKRDNAHPNVPMFRSPKRDNAAHRIVDLEKQRAPKLCTDCLRSDLATHGEPYWRRTHQMNASVFCASHGCRLISACTACKLPFAYFSKTSLVSSIPLICDCGQSLSAIHADRDQPEYFRALTAIVDDAMKNECFDWTYEKVVSTLSEELRRLTPSGFLGDGYDHFLRSVPLTLESDPSNKKRFLASDRGQGARFPLSKTFHQRDGVTMAAIIAFFGWRLDSIRNRFAESAVNAPSVKRCGHNRESLRQALMHWKERNRGLTPRHQMVYWRLCMLYPDVIIEVYPDRPLEPIPSLDSDREKVMEIVLDPSLTTVEVKKRLMSAHRLIRERLVLRDADWYAHQLDNRSAIDGPMSHLLEGEALASNMFPRFHQPEATTFGEWRYLELFGKIQRAIDELMRDDLKPLFPSITAIAEMVGATVQVTKKAIMYTDLTEKRYRDARDTYHYRLCYFAAGAVLAKGIYLTAFALLGRNTKRRNAAKRAILDYARDHQLTADQYKHYEDVPSYAEVIAKDRSRYRLKT